MDKYKLWDNIKRIVKLLQSRGAKISIFTIPPFRIDKPEHENLEFVNTKIRTLSLSGELSNYYIVSYLVALS